ncbi:mucin [Colletotrichum musicola]|uniref:Mucin n=1 Tax=Colletotrichum musicola TaxID=2175873 RepID=A0A8H6IQG6_9PEZI|nr:mucin [Colletotrichum musicola]
MPYNTRRKSLSLPSLGIHVPGSTANRTPLGNTTSSRSISDYPQNGAFLTGTITSHPNKRQKRSHGEGTRHKNPSLKRPDEQASFDHTPPPSPTADCLIEVEETANSTTFPKTVDLKSINDQIVEAAIVQLQATANRPHLVKELATVLSQQLAIVQHSANPCAIISSRLTAYIKRPCWTALSPCPLAKDLETAHPRRTYFYLTTSPRLPFPESGTPPIPQRSVISPSLSSVASGSDNDDDDDMELRQRQLSPSPEVDLSSPEFDDADDDVAMPTTPVGSLPNSLRYDRCHRSASPPLEKDEREFTQTADVLQKRKLARELSTAGVGEHSLAHTYDAAREDAMFDERQSVAAIGVTAPIHFITSPAIKASMPPSSRKDGDGENWLKLGTLLEWDHNPENIELDELDCLLDTC